MDMTFIRGLIRKTLILGVIASAAALYIGKGLSLGVAVGAVLSVLNILLMSVLVRRLMDVVESGGRPVGTSLLLTGKLAAMLGLIFFLIAKLGVDPVGFALGFGLFVPGLVWQTLTGPPSSREG